MDRHRGSGHSRWCLLKRPENLTAKRAIKLKELLACNLRTIRAYLLKEEFQLFWEYLSPAWAAKLMDQWCTKALRSRLEPMRKSAGPISGTSRSRTVPSPLRCDSFSVLVRASKWLRVAFTN